MAVEPQRYRSYREAVRAEYAHIPERDYVESRIAIITRLLARRRLFVSPFSLSWEEPARENLTAELSHLRARLRALEGPPADGADGSVPDGGRGAGPRPGRTSADEPTATTGGAGDDEPADDERLGGEPAKVDPIDDALAEDEPAEEEPTDEEPADDEPVVAPESETSLSGIEREPDLDPRRRGERRGRRLSRRDRGAPPARAEDIDSTGSLFRPPPTLPRP